MIGLADMHLGIRIISRRDSSVLNWIHRTETSAGGISSHFRALDHSTWMRFFTNRVKGDKNPSGPKMQLMSERITLCTAVGVRISLE